MTPFSLFYNFDPTDPPRVHHRAIDAEYWDWLFGMLQETGLTFSYRCNTAGRAYYHSRHLARFDHDCVERQNPDAAVWHRVAEMLEGHDPLACAVAAARKHGVPIRAWLNFNEFQNVRRDWVYLIDPVWYEKPRKYWCSRDGSRFYHGVPDFGDVEVQRRLLDVVDEVMSYGVQGIHLSTRSHSWFACWPSPGWDQHMEPFGFNDSVVDAYKKRHGVDIRYDDYDEEAWHRIKGEHFSNFIHAAGTRIHGRGGTFNVGISPDRYLLMGMGDQWAGKQNVKLYKDWEGWVAAGSIDALCSEQGCPDLLKLDGASVKMFQSTLPDGFPIHTWVDLGWWVNRDGKPFSLHNWNRPTVDQMIQQIQMARDTGAAGAVLHTMYHYTAADTRGVPIGGYGELPRTEYFDALRSLRQ